MKMLVITLFAATLVVASSAWPSENTDDVPMSADASQDGQEMDRGTTFDEDSYAQDAQEMELEDDDVAASESSAFGQFYPVPPLKVGQTIRVGYINPSSGSLSINLATANNDIALHFNPRLLGASSYLVLNTYYGRRWRDEIHLTHNPSIFRPRARVYLRIKIGPTMFYIYANGKSVARYAYRHGLTYRTVRRINWVAPPGMVVTYVSIN